MALSEDDLGPGHLLARRGLELARGLPSAAVRFVSPLRNRRGNLARGAALLHRETLRQLLTWPLAERRPDLAIILVDCDEEPDRKARLEEFVVDLPVPKVIAVAVQEFEAWLIADPGALRGALGPARSVPKDPEQMPRREAKELLASWLNQRPSELARTARMTLASTCDLGIVRRRCPAFDAFVRELGARGG